MPSVVKPSPNRRKKREGKLNKRRDFQTKNPPGDHTGGRTARGNGIGKGGNCGQGRKKTEGIDLTKGAGHERAGNGSRD